MKRLTMMMCALLLASGQSHAATPAAYPYTNTSATAFVDREMLNLANQVVVLINARRQQVGCPPVRLNSTLTLAARRQSDDMAQHQDLRHESHDGKPLATRLDDVGYDYQVAAENIAAGQMDAEEVVREWMNSLHHRVNIVDCSLRETGVAIAKSSDEYELYWTQVFGTRM